MPIFGLPRGGSKAEGASVYHSRCHSLRLCVPQSSIRAIFSLFAILQLTTYLLLHLYYQSSGITRSPPFCFHRSTCSQSIPSQVALGTLVLHSIRSLSPGRRPALHPSPRVRLSASPSHTHLAITTTATLTSPTRLYLVSARRVSSSSLLPSSFLTHRSFAILSNSSSQSIYSPAPTFAHDRQSDYITLLSAQRNFGPFQATVRPT